MYTHILVPLDGSAFGERALPIALALARRSGARVELVHAHERLLYPSGAPMYDPRLDDEFKAEMGRGLTALAERLKGQSGLSVAAIFLEGPVTAMLRAYTATSGADLIVMTTHGYGGLSRAWLGSIADHLVRHSAIPVLIVRPGAMAAGHTSEPFFRRVLVPLDGSAVAETALDHAIVLGTPGETEYVLLQVVVPLPILGHPYPYPTNAVPVDRGDLERRQQEARTYLGRVRAELLESGFAAKAEVVVHRQIARGILEYARVFEADLIALATHGRGAMGRLIVGSVADKILRAATVPVLMYHPSQGRVSRPAEPAGEVAGQPASPPGPPTAA